MTTTTLVIDADAAFTQEVARAIRATHHYCEIVPAGRDIAGVLERGAGAVIICAASDADAQLIDPWLDCGLPALLVSETAMRPAAHHLPVTDLHGPQLAEFLGDTAGLAADWTPANILASQLEAVRAQVGDARLICGLSGGVDSAVAAAIVQRAVGDQLTCVFVDHGLLRAGEREQVERDFVAATGVTLITIDASETFLAELAGVTEPERKRHIIGEQFIRTFEKAAADLVASDGAAVKFLVQGTIYPDVVESGSDGSALIKSHHNVGGLPDDLEFELVEPLRQLFKDEVRLIGTELGLPDEMVHRHPFPGPGLGVRVVGALDKQRLDILRAADAIVRQEMAAAGVDRQIWQCPVVLLADVRSVGITGGARSYGMPIVLRPIISQDAMTADWARLDYDLLDRIAGRITAEVAEVTRVVLDVTRKPPGTIEWE